MSRTRILSAVAAAALLAACAAGIMPGTAVAGEFDTNVQQCTDQSADPDLRIGACTWLLQSVRLTQENDPIVHNNRGIAWGHKGEYDRAIEDYSAALSIKPDTHDVHYNRGVVWDEQGEYDRAIEDYSAALSIKPDDAAVLNSFAWLLATAPEALVRDGPRAVRLAERSDSLQDNANSRDTLAAAYAEAGRFADAVGAQERAVAMALSEGWSADGIADFESRLRLYRQGRPYREQR